MHGLPYVTYYNRLAEDAKRWEYTGPRKGWPWNVSLDELLWLAKVRQRQVNPN